MHPARLVPIRRSWNAPVLLSRVSARHFMGTNRPAREYPPVAGQGICKVLARPESTSSSGRESQRRSAAIFLSLRCSEPLAQISGIQIKYHPRVDILPQIPQFFHSLSSKYSIYPCSAVRAHLSAGVSSVQQLADRTAARSSGCLKF